MVITAIILRSSRTAFILAKAVGVGLLIRPRPPKWRPRHDLWNSKIWFHIHDEPILFCAVWCLCCLASVSCFAQNIPRLKYQSRFGRKSRFHFLLRNPYINETSQGFSQCFGKNLRVLFCVFSVLFCYNDKSLKNNFLKHYHICKSMLLDTAWFQRLSRIL